MVDFLGIGVQKGGTTWLFHQLARHPQIAFPAGKEVHFWDRVDGSLVKQWLEILEPPSRSNTAGQPIRTGEITPAYASLPTETIRAIHAACPDIRLFISFRNPLERAWSAARMAMVRAQMLDSEVSDQWFIDHFQSAASRSAGDYSAIMERWLAVFPEEQLLTLLCDDIEDCPTRILDAISEHLGINPKGFAGLSAAALAERVVPLLTADQAYKRKPDLPPRPTLVPVLKDMYAPEVARIARFLGRDLTHWVDGFGVPAAYKRQPRREIRIGAKGAMAVDAWLAKGGTPAAPPATPSDDGAPGVNARRTRPALSVIAVFRDMAREAPRTLFTLSPGYQLGVDPWRYEVIVVDAGSTVPLDSDVVASFGPGFTLLRTPPSPSPSAAINEAVRLSTGEAVMICIDGARMLTPGVVRLTLDAFRTWPDPVVATLAWHLGPKIQNESMLEGYDQAVEDRLLESVDWRRDGYELFRIAAYAGSSKKGWFLPTSESNAVAVRRETFDRLGGFDEGFQTPGGGLVNLDFHRRACAAASPVIHLLGEGTFHQFHGGVATNVPQALHPFQTFHEEYKRLRGEAFSPPTAMPLVLGGMPWQALPFLEASIAEARAAHEG
ncbi:MAG: hypothetical protein FGM40_01305 [Rhodocyclaceae bacterium]|nr:hypothetical protein [Rhodocyclaceae bacterium]